MGEKDKVEGGLDHFMIDDKITETTSSFIVNSWYPQPVLWCERRGQTGRQRTKLKPVHQSLIDSKTNK